MGQPVTKFSKIRAFMAESITYMAKNVSVHGLVHVRIFQNELMIMSWVSKNTFNIKFSFQLSPSWVIMTLYMKLDIHHISSPVIIILEWKDFY
jgi:hypothetical protein